MEHRTHYDGSSASHTSGQQQQAASQQSSASTGPSAASTSAASAALRRSPFVKRMQRLGLVGETYPLVGLWMLGFTMLGWMAYRSMGEHLRVRNADRALRAGGDLDDAVDEEQQDDRGSDEKGGISGGSGGGSSGGAAVPTAGAFVTPVNQVATSPAVPASSDAARGVGAASHARAASSVFSPLPSDHTTHTHATIAQTRVRSTTGDREIGTTEGAELWSEHDPADLAAVLSLVEPPLSRPRTLHRAVLKLMAIERDMLPMISFPEYNFE